MIGSTAKTDEAGRFAFTTLPADVTLFFRIEGGPGRPEYLIRDGDRKFAPGEEREEDDLKALRIDPQAAAPAARRVARA